MASRNFEKHKTTVRTLVFNTLTKTSLSLQAGASDFRGTFGKPTERSVGGAYLGVINLPGAGLRFLVASFKIKSEAKFL